MRIENSVGVLPLQIRLTGFILTLLVLMLSANTILSIESERQAYRSELEYQGELLLNFLASAVQDSLAAHDGEKISAVLKGIENWDSILVAGRVYDERGGLISAVYPDAVSPPVDESLIGSQLIGGNGDLHLDWYRDRLTVGRQIRLGQVIIGGCSIDLSTELINGKMRDLQIRMTIIATIIIIIGVFLSFPISRSITRPIEQMVEITRRIADGQHHLKVPLTRNDEIGTLARSFNAMVSELNRSMNLLRESEERYALSVNGANDGIWDWDIQNDRIYLSTRWKRMIGYEDHEIPDAPDEWFNRIHLEDRDRVQSQLERHLHGETSHFEEEYRLLHKSGDYIWVLSRGVAVRTEGGYTYRIAGSQSDITLRKRTEKQLLHNALHDPLTGLPNRRYLLERLLHIFSHPEENGFCSVLFLDFDRFKYINDSFGHAAGDELLVGISYRLKQVLRTQDLLVRLSGDEFVILLENTTEPSIPISVADRILLSFGEHFELKGYKVFISVSIGIVLGSDQYYKPEDIIRDADIAMYRAKTLGKGRYEIFRPEMRQSVQDSFNMERSLRVALDNNELVLHFQPIFRASDSMILGFEALVRWNHPERGLLPPSDFLPLAEEIGLAYRIDIWVVEAVVHTICDWRKSSQLPPDFLVTVNLSSLTLSLGRSLVNHIRNTLQHFDIPPKYLGIEITEHSLIPSFETTSATLKAIRNEGCSVLLDDFGSGYSSLSYLHRVVFDYLKIDSSFVSSMSEDPYTSKIIRSIMHLAQELNLKVIAEGIDSREKLDELRLLGCTYLQGYLFSAPLTADDAGILYGHSLKAAYLSNQAAPAPGGS